MKQTGMKNILRGYLVVWLILGVIITAGTAFAGNMLYFGGFSTQNSATGNMDVLIVWGELEGSIPETVTGFNVYRKPYTPGDFSTTGATLLDGVNSVAGNTTAIDSIFNEPGEALQKNDVMELMTSMTGEEITDGIFADRLSLILANSEFKKFLLSRFSRNIARLLGKAYVDRNPGSGEFTYFIKGILSGGGETKPLGMTTVNTSSETVLPVPDDFRQVLAVDCSELNKGIDHERVHFNWNLPASPEMMALNTMIYGYDIYRSETGGDLDLRTGIPSHLTKVNPLPVVVAGNSAESGPDAYLAYDDGGAMDNGDGLNGGDTRYYYLVARDLTGRYSETAGPIEVVIPDKKAPVMPWNVHTQRREIDVTGTMTPMMVVLWDQINPVNYIKNYGRNRSVCTSSNKEICLVENPKQCGVNRPFCVDIDVQRYLVYRFDSFENARNWGTDSDGDLWPDDVDSDPCDPKIPGGVPGQIIARIDQDEPVSTETLGIGKKINMFIDTTPAADNTVFWYRVSAVDAAGNQSPLSPPQRAALWDRTQPEVNAVLSIERCDYTATYSGCTAPADPDARLIVKDTTGNAKWFELYETCRTGAQITSPVRMLYRGKMEGDEATITSSDLGNYSESTSSCNSKTIHYIVRFYNSTIQYLGESEAFHLPDFLSGFGGCVTLSRACSYVEYTPYDTLIPAVIPGEPLDVCATLKPGESARILRKTGGKMTPLKTIANNTDTGAKICETIDVTGIVATNACMGVRVMSPNGVGSKITYFHCVPVLAGPPEKPIMEKVEKNGTEAEPSFNVTWSAQSEGIAAFTVEKVSENGGAGYETFWDLTPDPATGQFTCTMAVDPSTIDEKWCFKVRAMDKILQLSDWSGEKCKVWNTPVETESLKWPSVSPMADAGTVTAFVVAGENIPVIDLSGDLVQALTDYEPHCADTKSYDIPDCSEAGTCFTEATFNCDMCGLIKSWNRLGKFVVYRQEENKPFVQVSPLVSTFHCFLFNSPTRALQDPMVFMQHYGAGSVATVSEGSVSDIEETTRLIFADWYPHKSGSKVRYKVVSFGSSSGEPEREYTSGWLTMP